MSEPLPDEEVDLEPTVPVSLVDGEGTLGGDCRSKEGYGTLGKSKYTICRRDEWEDRVRIEQERAALFKDELPVRIELKTRRHRCRR